MSKPSGRIQETRSLHELRPAKSSASGKEFARIVNLLLFHDARRRGKQLTLLDDRAGDFHGLDAFEGKGNSIAVGYQHKFYPSPLTNSHRKDDRGVTAKDDYRASRKEEIGAGSKLLALGSALLPRLAYWLPCRNRNPESPAVILSTSGTEGSPKGVVLSHTNLQSNRYQVSSMIDFGPQDRVFNLWGRRGPNVMSSYLRAEKLGLLQPPLDGWYDTGDIVHIDSGGFLSIRGRAKRFAKIGGEMVSLAAVETLAASLWPDHRHAVVSLPDEKKGEQLILATDNPEAEREALAAYARQQGVAALQVPARVQVVEEIPVLGSGKTDYRGVMELVESEK